MLEWIEPDEPLPDLRSVFSTAVTKDADLPNGLIAVGRDLSATRLIEAYSAGIFPWFVDGQPVLWWSPDPRMVLYLDEFSIPKSLAKTVRKVTREHSLVLTMDQQFSAVMLACAAPRTGQDGTWITADMINAYIDLHAMGLAHSIEVWQPTADTEPLLVGGLYGVSLGQMFFGESMFTRVNNGSKIALVYLVNMLRDQGFRMIDCQQNTDHLARFGAREINRSDFLSEVAQLVVKPAPDWRALQQNFHPA
ncbi:MAG: leucyl/phenylalanyl-tRNA--protein transferase [Burkholderiaceae bacterium]